MRGAEAASAAVRAAWRMAMRSAAAAARLGIVFTVAVAGGSAATAQNPMPAIPGTTQQVLAQADAALQAGEADRALNLLGGLAAGVGAGGRDAAEADNLLCRVRFMLEQWDAAIAACQQAVKLDAGDSDYHLWLGRAYGEKAARASFLTAYSLAKQTRAEFEDAVRLDAANGPALSDLGNFDRQAPGVVGGGIDKAQVVAAALDKVDVTRAHLLRGQIGEQQKDYAAAEREYKQAIGAAGAHPAVAWNELAGFYARRQRFAEMEQAIHSVMNTAMRDNRVGDKRAGAALYDSAGLLIENHQDAALAAALLGDYLDSPAKTEEAPAFIAHLRLAQLKQQSGDAAAAERERKAALALAQGYKASQAFNANRGGAGQGPQQAKN